MEGKRLYLITAGTAVLLLKTGSIPKTSSGKIQRYLCRAGFLNESLDIVGSSIFEDSSSTPKEVTLTHQDLRELNSQERHLQLADYLQVQVTQVLKIAQSHLDVQQPLSTVGLDSLMAIELKNCIETNLGVVLPAVPAFSLICEQDRLKLPDDIEDAYPLTQLQMGMLFHSEYNLDTPIYHNVSSYHLQAPFNLQYFQTAVQQLAVRHPVLRTSFEMSKFNEALQLVHQVVNLPLQVEDIRHLSVTQQEKVFSNCFKTEKRSLFDWTKAPLLRFYIHRRSQKTFQFTLIQLALPTRFRLVVPTIIHKSLFLKLLYLSHILDYELEFFSN